MRYDGGNSGYRGGGGYHNRRNERRYQPYRSNNSRGRGRGYDRDRDRDQNNYHRSHRNRHPGNRFDNNAGGHTKSVDPQEAMLKQLSAMVATMGDFENLASSATTSNGTVNDSTGNLRGVVRSVAKNIQDLTNVLCSAANAALFLKFERASLTSNIENSSIQAADEAGPLATLVTSCVAALPLQSPSYVGLTFGLDVAAQALDSEEESQEEQNEEDIVKYKGFAKRCVVMACRRLASDLASSCVIASLVVEGGEEDAKNAESSQNTNAGNSSCEGIHAFVRVKLLLRYIALLARVGVIPGHNHDEENENSNWDGSVSDKSLNRMSNLSMEGLLHLLTEAATRAFNASKREQSQEDEGKDNPSSQTYKNVSVLLSMLVLSTIPYTLYYLTETQVHNLLSKIDAIISGECYKSLYEPGSGIMSLLLKSEQLEESIAISGKEDDDDEDSDDDDDDDDNDGDETTPVCADTFQELFRTVRKVVELHYNSTISSKSDNAITKSTRFSLLSDAPWQGLHVKPVGGDNDLDTGEDKSMKIEREKNNEAHCTYSGEKISINLPETCLLIPFLLASGSTNDSSDDVLDGNAERITSLSSAVLQCHHLEGILFGRLSIFDPPPTDDDDDDDDDEEDTRSSPEEDAYVTEFSLIDRYFLSETIRECLICHQSNVSDTGLEKGNIKDVAVQIWSVCHLFLSPLNQVKEDDSSQNNICKGVEYGIVETILSLIIQAPRGIESSSPLNHVYLSRVLLALTKYQPSRVPQCLATAVSVLFSDFIPSMSPISRDSFSYWFSFHLTNTDYQWPHNHWVAWTPYAVKGIGLEDDEGGDGTVGFSKRKRNSRGEVLASIIQTIVTYASSPLVIVTDCLPIESPLCDLLLVERVGVSSSVAGEESVLIKSADNFSSTFESVQEEINDRIWKQNDDPDTIQDYIIGDELLQSVQKKMDDLDGSSSSDQDRIWWRTGLLVQSLLRPVIRDRRRFVQMVEKTRNARSDGDALKNQMVDVNEDDDYSPTEDAVADVRDSFSRYKTVLLASLAKDIQAYEENLDLGAAKKSNTSKQCEMYVLRKFEKLASYSSVLLESCVESCVKLDIVSVMGVLWWLLDEGHESERDLDIVCGWWKIASLVLRIGVINILSNSKAELLDSGGDIGMIIDSGGDKINIESAETSAVKKMKEVTDYAAPLMKYVISRVSKLLANLSDSGRKKMLPLEVDLEEGLKYFVRTASSHIVSALSNDPVVKTTADRGSALKVENWISHCELNFYSGANFQIERKNE